MTVETEVIDPEAPVQFLRVVVDGEEAAMIPWEEAEAIAEAVENYSEADGETHTAEGVGCDE